jgi:acetyltransferase
MQGLALRRLPAEADQGSTAQGRRDRREKGLSAATDRRTAMMEQTKTAATQASAYPENWETVKTLGSGLTVRIRPIQQDDGCYYPAFMKKCTLEDIRHRFFETMREMPADTLGHLTHIDYDVTMAFGAFDPKGAELLGVARYARDADPESAEFTVMTRSDMKHRGIGFALMRQLLAYAEARHIRKVWVQVMRDNPEMIQMCVDLGFQIEFDETDITCIRATRRLD